jgi:hypothetical protein
MTGSSVEPGIHNPRLWFWIPGLRLSAHPGMTAERVVVPETSASLRIDSEATSLRGLAPVCNLGWKMDE